MDITKIITLTIIGIVSIGISLTVTKFFLRAARRKSESKGEINLSYTFSFSTWVIAFSLLSFKSISILSEYVDLIDKTNAENPITEVMKVSALFIGLTNLWLVICYFLAKVFYLIFIEKRDSMNEIENDNYKHFILKGMLILSFIYCLTPIFEILLRSFFPIEIPFYR